VKWLVISNHSKGSTGVSGKIIFVGLLLLASVCNAQSMVGQDAPPIIISQWITEEPPDISNLAGKVYVLEFWATWCTPCKENVPHLNEVNKKYKEYGVELIALAEDKSIDIVRKFVREKKIGYSVAVDYGTVDRFGINAYPTIVVVNHLGRVVWQGYPWESDFEKAVSRAAREGPPPLLAGVDLGSFGYLKKPLCGGNGFAQAYHQVESCMNNQSQPQSAATAKIIVETINSRISEKISKADGLRYNHPLEAYSIYADLIARYDGIETVQPAKAAYYELRKLKSLNKI
jgi:thiol-disulfide isomerase/thioredoxin